MPNEPTPFETSCRIAEYMANGYYGPGAVVMSSKFYGRRVWTRQCYWIEHCTADFDISVDSNGHISGECDCCPVGERLFKSELKSLLRGVRRFGLSYIDVLEEEASKNTPGGELALSVPESATRSRSVVRPSGLARSGGTISEAYAQ
jgi:hypothetical protein